MKFISHVLVGRVEWLSAWFSSLPSGKLLLSLLSPFCSLFFPWVGSR